MKNKTTHNKQDFVKHTVPTMKSHVGSERMSRCIRNFGQCRCFLQYNVTLPSVRAAVWSPTNGNI